MAVRSIDDLITRRGLNMCASETIAGEVTATLSTLLSGQPLVNNRRGEIKVLPSLPSGVGAFIPTWVVLANSSGAGQSFLIGQRINFGSLDISSNVFTTGDAMPTVTTPVGSLTLASPVYVEVTTVLNATPGSISVTYGDQSGNTDEATTAQAMAASAPVGSGGIITFNAADWGAQHVTSAVRSAGTTPTGVLQFWGFVPFALIMSDSTGVGILTGEAMLQGGVLRRLGAAAQPGIWSFGSNAVGRLEGTISYIGDST